MTINVERLQQGGYTAQNDRNATTAAFTKSAVGSVLAGIVPSDGSDFGVTAQGSPNMTLNVSKGQIVIPDAVGGAYVFTSDATQVVTIPTAPSSGTRYDLVIARVYDNAAGDAAASGSITLPGSAGSQSVQSFTGTIEVVEGTAGGSPLPPSLPNTRCVVLKVVAVGTNVTSISNGNLQNSQSTTSRIGYTVASGGILPCASSAVYPATPYVGMTVYDIARDCLVKWNGSAWTTPGPLGMLAVANSPGHSGLSSLTILTSVTVTLVAGRKYKVTAAVDGVKHTTGTIFVALAGTTGVPTNNLVSASIADGFAIVGATSVEFTPGSSGSFAFQVTGQAGSGTFDDSTKTQIFVEDIGN